jgi:excisionase family DNA binding protein
MPKTRLSDEAQSRLRKRLYSVDEAAFMLGLDRSWLYRLINAGEIKAVRSGRRRLIPEREVSAYLAKIQADAG